MAAETRRVLLVIGPAAGGMRAHVAALAAHLARRGWPVTVAGPPLAVGSIAPPVAVVALAGPVASWPGRVSRLARGHDLVHAHGLTAAAVSLPAAAPLVVTWHNAALGSLPRRWAVRQAQRWVSRRAALVLAVSPDLARLAAAAPRVRLIEVPAPALAAPAPAQVRQIRAELSPQGRPIVLAVTRLHPQKRLDVLIAAASGWRRPTDPVVAIAGEGPARQRLADQIAATGAPVRLLGARPDVSTLLAAADVVALPSEWEGWPLAAAEALAAGRLLVATDVPGTRRLAGAAARYVPVGNPTALREAVVEVLADPDLQERLRIEALCQRQAWLTLDQANDLILKDYLTLS